jgi:hypothetical protein
MTHKLYISVFVGVTLVVLFIVMDGRHNVRVPGGWLKMKMYRECCTVTINTDQQRFCPIRKNVCF